MWQERLSDQPGIKQLVACIDGHVAGHLASSSRNARAAAMWLILGFAWRAVQTAALPAL
jgi:putative acetyltransferase